MTTEKTHQTIVTPVFFSVVCCVDDALPFVICSNVAFDSRMSGTNSKTVGCLLVCPLRDRKRRVSVGVHTSGGCWSCRCCGGRDG